MGILPKLVSHPQSDGDGDCDEDEGGARSPLCASRWDPKRRGVAFRLRGLLVSPLLTEVLPQSEVVVFCCPEQWCPAILIPRILVGPLLAQVLHHREVTIRPVVYCHIDPSPPRQPPARTVLHHREVTFDCCIV